MSTETGHITWPVFKRVDGASRGPGGLHIDDAVPEPAGPAQNQDQRVIQVRNSPSHIVTCGCGLRHPRTGDTSKNHSVLVANSGLYVYADVGNCTVKALLDTGSELNLLNYTVYENIPMECRPELSAPMHIVKGIGGHSIETVGVIQAPLTMVSKEFNTELTVVKGLTEKMVIGLPFLRKAECKLDCGKCKMTVSGESVPLYASDSSSMVGVVKLVARVTIQAGEEKLVWGKPSYRQTESTTVVTLPSRQFVQSEKILVGKIIADTTDKTQLIPLSLYNPDTMAHSIKAGKVVAVMEEVVILEPEELVGKGLDTKLVGGIQTNLQEEKDNKDPLLQVPPHLQDLYNRSKVHISDQESVELAQLLREYQDVFSRDKYDLGRTALVKHDIELTDTKPVKVPPRRLPPEKEAIVEEQIKEGLDRGIMSPSQSPWAAPLVLVRKKNGSHRICADYRALNSKTVKDSYPIPNIDQAFNLLAGSKYFGLADFSSGYWQVELSERAKKYASFVTRSGVYTFNVMPFGLCNSPLTWQRLMDRILTGMQWEKVLIYVDDLILFSKDTNEMFDKMREVLDRFKAANLKLRPEKCTFFQKEIAYLGHVVSETGIRTDPSKVAAVKDWPQPTNVHEVKKLLGFASYYQRFLANFAEVCAPLTDLTKGYKGKKGTKGSSTFEWTDQCQEAFETLKELLTTAPVLALPNNSDPLILDTDASSHSIGSVLSQVCDGEERVLAYGSHKLSPTQQSYCTTKRELLALVYFCRKFRQFLLGRKFTVRVDHYSLKWLVRFKNAEDLLARWLESLADYHFEVEHRPGSKHINADALSRQKCRKTCPCKLKEPVATKEQSVQVDPIELNCRVTVGQREGGWSREYLQEMQVADPNIGPLIKYLEEREKRPMRSEINPCSPATKSYWNQWDRLVLQDGLVCRKYYPNPESTEYRLQLLLPVKLQKQALEFCHDKTGHFGAKKTLARLQLRYHWYQMGVDTKLWCRTCVNCSARKRTNRKPRIGLGNVPTGAPFERLSTDIMGPLSESNDHNVYILVVQCYFSKYLELYALPNQEAETVASTIVDNWIARYGCPLEIHSDRGTNYQSATFEHMCQLLGINKTSTCAFRPMSDGQTERANAVIQDILYGLSLDVHWEWDRLLPMAQMCYNSSEHTSTGFTPFCMLYGREMIMPMEIETGWFSGCDIPQGEAEYVTWLRESLTLVHGRAREALGKAATRAKKYYDQTLKVEKYKIGDPVWYLRLGVTPRGKCKKFLPKYVGPYFITRKLDDNILVIKKDKRSKPKTVHHDQLKPYVSREEIDNSWVFQQKQTRDAEGEPNMYSLENTFMCIDDQNESGDGGPISDDSDIGHAGLPPDNDVGQMGAVGTGTARQRRPPKRYGDWV